MYADRNARSSGVNAGSLVAAVAINAAVIGALVFSAPVIDAIRQRPTLRIENIPLDPPPPEAVEPPPRAATEQRAAATPERPDTSAALLPTAPSDGFVVPPLPLPPLPPIVPGGEITRADPPAPPVIVDARPDPRYARQMQPVYPPGERRAEREGQVTVRVTIGSDGRVLAAECLAATSAEFCRATRQQALSKWRFQPATRDGIATEATKEMTVRFELLS